MLQESVKLLDFETAGLLFSLRGAAHGDQADRIDSNWNQSCPTLG
jgi:hypothetical protein